MKTESETTSDWLNQSCGDEKDNDGEKKFDDYDDDDDADDDTDVENTEDNYDDNTDDDDNTEDDDDDDDLTHYQTTNCRLFQTEDN